MLNEINHADKQPVKGNVKRGSGTVMGKIPLLVLIDTQWSRDYRDGQATTGNRGPDQSGSVVSIMLSKLWMKLGLCDYI